MKIISWNVNGIRAAGRKGFLDAVKELDADVLCIQEIKANVEDIPDNLKNIPDYHAYFYSADKKGYSGTAIYSKEEPQSVVRGIGDERFDAEGRVLTAEFEDFFVISTYVVNAQDDLGRLPLRMEMNDALKAYAKRLEEEKPVIITGDFNVAHQPMDLKNDKANEGKKGFTIEERQKFTELLDAGFIDTFRHLHPDEVRYTYWSYRGNARANNTGWRVDYVVVSEALKGRVREAFIRDDIHGSDHCPLGVELK